MAIPINERARWYIANRHQFHGVGNDWAQPETWPEILAPIKAFCEAGGLRKPRVQGYNQDFAVQNIIGHYVAGHSMEELVEAYRGFVSSDLYITRINEGKRPHASWVTAGVLQRQLETVTPGGSALELARRQVEREKTVKTARLVAEVEHTQSLVDVDDEEWDPPAQLTAAGQLRALSGGGSR
jgi:hypothetical protein